MEKVIVIVARGKGNDGIDYIKPLLFDTTEEAEEYIEGVNDVDSKYWTYAEIVPNGVEIEPTRGIFYK
jgi:hypothetical protein